jgi:probable phosphoglycerate mutase
MSESILPEKRALAAVFIMRHGETAWSKSGQHTGRTDLPLTAQGEKAARKLGERLRATKFNHVFTSPRQRARQTCELAGLDTGAEVESDLAEWDYGDYEGKRSAEIFKTRPEWNLFRDGCPHGESPGQVSSRADRLVTRFRAMEGNIAVFTHGHFGRVLAARWIGSPVDTAQHFLLGTASVNILGFEHDNPAEPVITLWNSGPAGEF